MRPGTSPFRAGLEDERAGRHRGRREPAIDQAIQGSHQLGLGAGIADRSTRRPRKVTIGQGLESLGPLRGRHVPEVRRGRSSPVHRVVSLAGWRPSGPVAVSTR